MNSTSQTTIAVLGGGQLGQMLALAGIPLGLRFRFLDPSPDAPMAQVAEQIVGPYDDPDSLKQLAEGATVATYEFENVSASAVEIMQSFAPVRPGLLALKTGQDRIAEKSTFNQLGIGTPKFASINSEDELAAALDIVGLPAVLKTTRMGYDGKGQAVVKDVESARQAVAALGGTGIIAEQWVPFNRELSILGVRSLDGSVAFYPLVENVHREGILRQSIAPAPGVAPELQAQAEDYSSRLMKHLDYVGVLALELFQCGDQLLANEMAPRVHNSGHWTIEGAETSQFENHVRAILGWPLGSTNVPQKVGMLNIIGNEPDVQAILSERHVQLHMYGKQPRAGRKIGHLTLVEASEAIIQSRLESLKTLL
jgi:5-(carboxyamino)imidazole ribonucleotide synthase